MSILRRGLVGRYPQFNNYVAPLSQLYGQTTVTSAAGERVDEWTALGMSSVLGAVGLLSDSVASLPLRAYETVNGLRHETDLPMVLQDPDPDSNIYELLHQVISSMALHGNAYLHIDRDKAGNMIGLVPLHPYQMQVLPTGDQVSRTYLHLGNELENDSIIHLRWFTPPQSLVGVSPLIQARNLMGLSLAMDRHLAQFYAEGATPSSVIESPDKLTREQASIIRDTWESTHRRHRRPAVLSNGAKWKPVQASAADTQMIETREQLIRDIARIYRIPSHLIGATGDNQTYQNVEQASLNFLIYTVTPWLRRVEIGLSKVLPDGVDVVFDFSALLRTDALTRAKVDNFKVAMGARTPNEVRQVDGYEPYIGGDVFHQSLMGTPLAGGVLPELGEDSDTNAPIMGVL